MAEMSRKHVYRMARVTLRKIRIPQSRQRVNGMLAFVPSKLWAHRPLGSVAHPSSCHIRPECFATRIIGQFIRATGTTVVYVTSDACQSKNACQSTNLEPMLGHEIHTHRLTVNLPLNATSPWVRASGLLELPLLLLERFPREMAPTFGRKNPLAHGKKNTARARPIAGECIAQETGKSLGVQGVLHSVLDSY